MWGPAGPWGGLLLGLRRSSSGHVTPHDRARVVDQLPPVGDGKLGGGAGTVLVFIALFLPWYSFPTGSGTANANAVSSMSSDLTPGA